MKKEQNILLKEAIVNKANIELGRNFYPYIMNIHQLGRLRAVYTQQENIFKKYAEKFEKLQKEYLDKLEKINITYKDIESSRPSNFTYQTLGKKLAAKFPELLDIEKANAWNRLNEVMEQVLLGQYENLEY